MDELFRQGYALLIGVTDSAVDDLALPLVGKDVEALERVLVHPRRCAYPPANVKTLTGQEATRAGILDGLAWLEERIGSDSSGNATAVVYYSGHGWRDRTAEPAEFFLLPYDVKENRIRSSALRAEDFSEAVDAVRPRRLLVLLDCCHAGGITVKGQPEVPSRFVKSAIAPDLLMGEGGTFPSGGKGLDKLEEGAGRAVLSSSRGEQQSYFCTDGAMSIFTYHLIEALTGHAQPQQGATEVLVSDVMGHVSRRVPQAALEGYRARQEPDYQVRGNFPVALLLGGKGLDAGLRAPDPLSPLEEAGARPPTVSGDTISATLRDVSGGSQVFIGKDIRYQNVSGAGNLATPESEGEESEAEGGVHDG